jgi:LuxR family maltose regulon positive regulatory protein
LSRLTLALEGCDAELWRRCMQSITAHAHRPGYLDALRQFIDAARRVAGDTHFHLRAWVHYYSLATATLIEGNVDAAEALLEAYHEDLDWLGLAVRRRFMFMKSFLSVIQGESEVPEIRALWKEAMTQRPPWPAFIADAAALLARQSANLGDWDHVREVVATVPHNPMFGRATLVRLPPQVLQARLALHDGHAQEAFDLLWPLLPGVDEADRLGNADFVRVTLAAACVRVGRWAEGWDALVPLIEAVRSTGNHGRLMLAGMALLAEIAGSRWPSPMAQDARIDLLRFWVAAAGSRGVSKAVEGGAAPLLRSVPPPVPGSGLSARELEVLALVAQGDSNKLIARKLDLSPHTVKRHVARILDRLQVNSRGAAARWFFDHGR